MPFQIDIEAGKKGDAEGNKFDEFIIKQTAVEYKAVGEKQQTEDDGADEDLIEPLNTVAQAKKLAREQQQGNAGRELEECKGDVIAARSIEPEVRLGNAIGTQVGQGNAGEVEHIIKVLIAPGGSEQDEIVEGEKEDHSVEHAEGNIFGKGI